MGELYFVWPLLVCFFASLLMTLVLHGKAGIPMHRMFALMLLAMALWGVTILVMRTSGSVGAAIAWEKGALIANLAVPLFFYHFTCLFPRQSRERLLLFLVYVASIATAGLVASGLVGTDMQRNAYGYAPRFGLPYVPYLCVVYFIMLLGIRNLLKQYRSAPSEAARKRTTYVLLGGGCYLLGSVSDSLPPVMAIYPVGIGGTLLFALFTAVAILKHNLLDVRAAIAKSFVYSVVSALILGLYIALLFSLGPLFQDNASALSWPGNLAAVLTVAILLKPLLDRVQRVADRWFWRRRYDYLRALESFGHDTKDITNLSQLATVLEQAITLAMGAEEVRLLMPSASGSQFMSVTDRGSHPIKLQLNSSIVAWLRTHDDVLRQEHPRTSPGFLSLSAHDLTQLEEFRVQLSIPIKHKGELAGILVLSGKRSEEPYSEEDLSLLRAAAYQTAMGLTNARLFASVVAKRTRLEQLLERAIQAQEDERKRLSMELHDSPLQWLTSAVYRLEACLEFFKRGQHLRARKELEETQQVMDTTLSELRNTTAALHPPELEKVGLVKALARYADAFERDTAISCHFEDSGSVPRLPAPVELAVYRVIQEALSNVRKHAQATAVQIQVGLQDGALRAMVRDNGVGFEVDDSRPTDYGHLGLAGMEERSRMLGGTLTVQSTPDVGGTQITLLIPQTESSGALNKRAKPIVATQTQESMI